MAAKTVKCAKLGQDLPGIDDATADGSQALRMCLLLGGPALRDRVRENISAQAWGKWKDHMIMVINEYRLDATSDQSNAVLKTALEDFLFGKAANVPGYVPKGE